MSHQIAAEPTIATRLGQFVAELEFDDIPQNAIDCVKAEMLDQLGCALIGSTLPWVAPAVKLVALTKGGRAESTTINYGDKYLAADAAFVNATFGQACELDSFTPGRGHIAAATVPVALAVGEREHVDGRGFLTSIIAGYEVECRLMNAIRPYNNERGFHPQSIAGPFAAAAVAGSILELSAEQMVHALAIAGSHSSGPLEYDQSGGEVKRIHAGMAARGGVQSAFLAQFGLTGPPTIIEGKRGFCNLFATKSDPSLVLQGLGETWHSPLACFKLYPTVATLHTALDGVHRLVNENGIAANDIAKINVGIAEKALLHGAGIKRPTDVLGAQFSLAFSVALAVVKRRNDLPDYMNPALWSDPELSEIMDRVEAYADPESVGARDHSAKVEIELKNGKTFETIEIYSKGSPKNPAPRAEIVDKARRLAGSVLPPDRVETLIEAVDNLEEVDDISDFVKLLVR